jgi:hypothetical protein
MQQKKDAPELYAAGLPLTAIYPKPLLCEGKVLRKWLAERGNDPSPFVFPSQKGACLDRRSFFHIFATAAKEAGLPADKQHCHVLKHALGYRLVEQGRSMPEIRCTRCGTRMTWNLTSMSGCLNRRCWQN